MQSKSRMEIKVGYIVAYDYALLKNSLPRVYKAADKIVLAIDKDRKTFTGESYFIEPEFFDWIKQNDPDGKILIYQDQFYVSGFSVEELDTRKRNMLAKFMGEGGWHFQVDADEYFVDFDAIVDEIKSLESKFKNRRVTFRIYWQTIFKATDEGFFLVNDSYENFALVTNFPVYETMRYNHSNENFILNHVALHQSFGRSEKELKQKFRNWSHANDFDTDAYFRFWQSVNRYNYRYFFDFNAVYPGSWMRLKYVMADSIESLLQEMSSAFDLPHREPLQKWQKWLPPVVYHRLKKFSPKANRKLLDRTQSQVSL